MRTAPLAGILRTTRLAGVLRTTRLAASGSTGLPRGAALAALGWLALPLGAAAQAADGPPSATLPPVEIIGTSPLPGQGVDRNLLPYSTQTVRRDRIDAARSDNLVDFMNRNLGSVQVNDIQGSPFQGDLTYRGFRASPLLGAGQGISVYLDGVRINEPFGDVVNWDLLPEFSIDSLTLVPGANPAFGLNTLGGALAFTTYSGLTAPGVRAELSGGSFGRARADLGYGAQYEGGWHSYIAGTGFREDGWRDESKGHLGNVLAKVGRVDGPTDWDLSLLYGRSTLIGNGLVPAYTLEEGEGGATVRRPDLYERRREAIYTYPDQTTNRLTQLGFGLRRQLGEQTQLSTLAYLRNSKRSTVNGDTADDDDAESDGQFNTTATKQNGWGLALALSGKSGAHQWQAGASVDASRVHYDQYERAATLTPDRGVTPGDDPAELSVAVAGRALAYGVYATDTWEIAPRTHLTGTARYNHARVGNRLTSVDDDTGEASDQPRERFTYVSLNPAIGIAHRLEAGPTLFANIARNNRAPTVIELGCADPAEPCRLPAGLQSDPYLKQVISRSAEFGLRWPIEKDLNASLAAFRTDNRHDILFRSVSVSGQEGFFQNFARTRYQGVDAELKGKSGPVTWQFGYSFLDPTYRADGVLRLGNRNVVVDAGTRIAGLPRHTLKLGADWLAWPGLTLGADLQATSRRVTAGNEDGRIEDGSSERVDIGVPGHAVLNLRLSFRPPGSGAGTGDGWELYVKLNNALDRRYENYAALAGTVFDAQGNYTGDETNAVFVAPGAPRSVFAGVRYRY